MAALFFWHATDQKLALELRRLNRGPQHCWYERGKIYEADLSWLTISANQASSSDR